MSRLKIVAGATPPRNRRDRTRLSLLGAAEKLMSARSVDAVSIDEIVDVAQVAKGTFYNHFPDKDALQHDVLTMIRQDIKARIGAVNAKIADPARRVARAFCLVLLYATENPERGNFLIRTSMAFRLVDDRMNQGLVQDIGIGLDEGRFPVATTESGALTMLGITQAALVQALHQTDRFPLAARAQQMGAMLLRGLGLPFAEAELIAAQEADHIIYGHDFAAAGRSKAAEPDDDIGH